MPIKHVPANCKEQLSYWMTYSLKDHYGFGHNSSEMAEVFYNILQEIWDANKN